MFRWSLWSLDFDGLLWAAFSVESCKNLLAGSERSRSFWNAGGLPSSIVARRESSSSFHLYEAATAREPRSGIGGRNDAITSTLWIQSRRASTKLKMLIFYTLWLTFFLLELWKKIFKICLATPSKFKLWTPKRYFLLLFLKACAQCLKIGQKVAFNIWAYGQTVLPDRSLLVGQK